MTLVWVKRVWRCVGLCPVSMWTETSEAIAARASLTERARAEVCPPLSRPPVSVSGSQAPPLALPLSLSPTAAGRPYGCGSDAKTLWPEATPTSVARLTVCELGASEVDGVWGLENVVSHEPAAAGSVPVAREVDFAQVYGAHRLAFVRLAVLLVDDLCLAEEIVQDAFLGLHRHTWRLRDPDNAVAYVRSAVVNGSRSALRRRRVARLYVVPHSPHSASAEAAVLVGEEHREVLAAVRQLPERQRAVLVLRYWMELPVRDVAETLKISEGTVKSTTARALAAVADLMKGAR